MKHANTITPSSIISSLLVVVIGLTSIMNGLLVYTMPAHAEMMPSGENMEALSQLAQLPMTEENIGKAWSLLRPTGVPPMYGGALGITYDETEAAMNVMRQYDPYQNPQILAPDVLSRYINIGLMISCEYCCGAQTLVYDNGVAACGCAHSKAMRGLTRYLLEAYPDMSNDEILAELVTWKSLYFPNDASAKALKQIKNNTFNEKTYLINNVK